MNKPQELLKRLDDIGESLAQTGHALALLGLGSVGMELDRLDGYSDLDFFVIVQDGYKAAFIENLDWLSRVCRITFVFQNSADGHKLLFEDGIFCETAVFETADLVHIPFAAGRVVWKTAEFDETRYAPPPQNHAPRSVDWLLGEALTNLYVGLGRYHRGEKLSAFRFIQGYAVDRVVELAALIETEQPVHRDPFAPTRRFEQRFPETAEILPHLLQGYDHTLEAARAILNFLQTHFAIHPALQARILEYLPTEHLGQG